MSPIQLWMEIAGILSAGALVAVLVVRASESKPKAASWKIPERIDKRLEEILTPTQSPSPEPSRRGMGWKSHTGEPVVIAKQEEKSTESEAVGVAEAGVHEGFFLHENLAIADERAVEVDAMAHRLDDPDAVYSHEKHYL